MIKNYFKKVIALSIITMSVISLNQIGVSAAWKQDNTGWWYSEGSSWAMGWKKVDGKWYYFYQNGYMAKNTKISGYKIDSNGVAENKPTIEQNPSSYMWKMKGQQGDNSSKSYDYIENDKVIGEMVLKDNYLYYMENGQKFNGWKHLGGPQGYNWYYIEEGKRCVGWKNIQGNWYYFSDYTSDSDADVYNLKGKMINTSIFTAGRGYEFDDYGVLQSTI